VGKVGKDSGGNGGRLHAPPTALPRQCFEHTLVYKKSH